eukprot:6487855-Amphidinium_carterae.3
MLFPFPVGVKFAAYKFCVKAGKKVVAAAQGYMKDPNARPFVLKDVQEVKGVMAEVSASYLVLNAAEFNRYFKGKPLRKDPKAPQIKVLNQSGVEESVYVFKDPSKPFREMRLVGSLSNASTSHIMDCGQHYHEKQAEKTFSSVAGKRHDISSTKSLLAPNADQSFSTLDEYGQTLEKHRAMKQKTKKKGAQGDSDEDDEEEDDADEAGDGVSDMEDQEVTDGTESIQDQSAIENTS